MNEKQKKLQELVDTVDYFKGCTAGVTTVIAEDLRAVVKLAHELLADEPEKSLRDYTLAELAELVHDMAKEKGWWDSKREWSEIACLIHSEISEAVECYRRGEMAMHVVDGKPEGLVVELADVLIRCLDYSAHVHGSAPGAIPYLQNRGIVAEETAKQNAHLDGCLQYLHLMHMAVEQPSLHDCVKHLFQCAKRFNLDLAAAVEAKIHYNATRPYRHGGKKA